MSLGIFLIVFSVQKDKGIQQNRYGIDLEMIWLEKINKIKSCMEVWKSRDLTYFGKKLIIKSFVPLFFPNSFLPQKLFHIFQVF
jgi:hypothetical protein